VTAFATVSGVQAYVTRCRSVDELLAAAMTNAYELREQTGDWAYSEDYRRIADIRQRYDGYADRVEDTFNRNTTWVERWLKPGRVVGRFVPGGIDVQERAR
jgi:hypothetical protein